MGVFMETQLSDLLIAAKNIMVVFSFQNDMLRHPLSKAAEEAKTVTTY